MMGVYTRLQFISGLAAGLTVLGVGCTTGWTTVALKRLEAPGSEVPVTAAQGSWIASCHEAGHVLSPLPVGYLLGRVGPKKCLVSSALLQAAGWLLIIFTRSVAVLFLVRFIFGISMGIIFTVTPLYIAEISNAEVRGALSTGFETMLYLGHVIEFSVGPYVSYDLLAAISFSVPLSFLILSVWMAESPYHLIKRGRYVEARETCEGLTGAEHDHESVVHHLASIEEHILESQSGSLDDLFGSPVYRRSLSVVLVLAVVQRFSGMSAVVAYASFIFPSTVGGLSSSSYTILFGVITLLFTFVSAALMDRSGRRVLTMISCSGSFVVEFVTALYFYSVHSSLLSSTQLTWIPFVSISMYAGFYSIGMGPVVTTVQGELFPPHVKGLAASLVTIVHATSGSLVTKCYQVISDKLGVYVSFLFFSVNCLVGAVFAYLVMPETKGKSLLEIQRENERT